MSAPNVNLDAIERALSVARDLAREQDRRAVSIDASDRARSDNDDATRGLREFQKLRAVWPRCLALLNEADVSYDRWPSSRPEGRASSEETT